MRRALAMRDRKAYRQGERGVLLVYTLLILLLISAVVAMASSAVLLRLQTFREEAKDVRMQALTDAALAEALAALAQDPSFGGYSPYDYAQGKIGSQILQQGTSQWRVIAESSWRNHSRRAEVRVRLLKNGRFRVDAYRPISSSNSP